MAQPTIQTSFASGEWAPKLRSRVDIEKYRAGAAFLRNFYVDFAGGGASTRPGTMYVNQAFKSSMPVRLIGFQPSSSVSYVLEFGDGYIRFHSNGAPILETPIAVTAASGNTITTAGNTYVAGDWVFYLGQYYIVLTTGASFTVSTLTGATPTLTFSGSPSVARVYTLTSPYAATDLFPSPITGNPGIKYAQDVVSLIICHPSYQPQILTINAPNSWSISTINFGSTIATPTGVSASTTLTSAANSWSYGYAVTAVDFSGQESQPSTTVTVLNVQELQTTAGTNTISWTAVGGAQSYNVYKLSPIFNTTFPTGAPLGFIGNTTATSFTDANPGFTPDFSQSTPVGQNPFQGAGVNGYTVTAAGTYTTVPGVTVAAPPSGGFQATANAYLGVTAATTAALGSMNTGGSNPQGSYLVFPDGVTFKITSASWTGFAQNGTWAFNINSVVLVSPGTLSGAGTATPTNPVGATTCTVGGFQKFNTTPTQNLTWGVLQVLPVQVGAGYTSVPAVTFSAGAAAATALLNSQIGGNPEVPEFFQERLVLAGQAHNVQSINMSQPASYFNFNVSFPIEDDDAISTQIISSDLNDIRSLTQVPTGLLAMTGKAGWLINGGGGVSTSAPVTPVNITAMTQAFNGANDVRPLKIAQDILYVTNKGNYVRDLTYNIWTNIFSGSDITTISNHLFFGTYITQWCWSEEPFKTAWVIRDDGVCLSLAYVKDQELVGWAHHDTNGQFTSVCSVIELDGTGDTVDAVYFVVQRQLPNGTYVKYVERMSNRYFPYGCEDSWCVDCALQTTPVIPQPLTAFPLGNLIVTGSAAAVGNSVTLTDTVGAQFTSGMVGNVVRSGGGIYTITAFTSSSVVTATVTRVPSVINPYTGVPQPWPYSVWAPVTVVSGLTQLIGQQVTGVADGAVVPLTTVSGTGTITLAQAASKITLGLPFLPQLQTLPLDLGEPTVQSKRKKVPAATMRVADTLGLQIGTTFANSVTVKDFQIGAIPTQSNGPTIVTDLYSGDGRTILDQVWQEPGQLCVQQNLPYPATLFGIMPEVVVGDSPEPGSRGR